MHMLVPAGGSADPEKNIQLATVLKKAKDLGVPKDNIEKALASVRNSIAACIFNYDVPGGIPSLSQCVKGKEQSGERLIYEALSEKTVGIIMYVLTTLLLFMD